ncbi:MAG: GTPase Era [Clostridiales bacterium]|nr:GTPase Era [Candidatus Equinaster intestinalis]
MSKTTSAFISIIGRPNVGKSSFLNKALSQKVSIVSDKPQTTRTRIMGVLTKGEKQLVFIDTPGFHKPKNLLGENMIKAVGSGMTDVDAVILIVDACPKFKLGEGEIPPAEIELIEELKRRKLKAILGINKIDLLSDKEELLGIISNYMSYFEFDAVVPFSAKTGVNVDELITEAGKFAHESVHYFADDDFTDQPERVMVSEMIREKLLRLLSFEVPHGIAVDIERFYEKDSASGEPLICVEATIYCEKESHKGIIIGKNGGMLKKVGSMARRDIENFFGTKTDLKLWVKVKEDWRNRQTIIHGFGLDNQ